MGTNRKVNEAATTDPTVRALKELCEKHGGTKQVAERIGANDQTLYQVVSGVLLPSGNPRGVGRNLRVKLDQHFPGWLDSSEHNNPSSISRLLGLYENLTDEDKLLAIALLEALKCSRAR